MHSFRDANEWKLCGSKNLCATYICVCVCVREYTEASGTKPQNKSETFPRVDKRTTKHEDYLLNN